MARRKALVEKRPLRRRGPVYSPRQKFLVVCEGKVTEPEYLQHVKNALRHHLLTIHVPNERGDPLEVVEIAVRLVKDAERAARRERDNNIRYDKAWCVVDVDEHARLSAAIKLAAENGISMAISNPCFEIWPYLHLAEQNSHISSHAIQKKLHSLLGGDPKKPDCNKIAGKYSQARERAIRLSSYHEMAGKSPAENPSTAVWKLIDELLATGVLPGTSADIHRL